MSSAQQQHLPCPILAQASPRKGWRPHPYVSRMAIFAISLAFSSLLAACHANHVEITVENRSGAPVRLFEVDYPSASFGADSLAAGADFHYKVKVLGNGPVTVTWTAPGGAQPKVTGPDLADHEQASLQIVLLPAGKADFHLDITPGR